MHGSFQTTARIAVNETINLPVMQEAKHVSNNYSYSYRNGPKFSDRRPWQTVQTQIRLFLEEESDQGLHCLSSCLHFLDIFLYGKAFLFEF